MKIIEIIITSLSTVGTLIICYFTFLSSKRSNDIQEKTQAKKITCWSKEDSERGIYCIQNSSDECIYNVFSFTRSNQQSHTSLEERSKYSDNNVLRFDDHKYIEIFPPKDTYKQEFMPIHAAGNEHPVPEIFFTDSSGTKWYRHADGILEKYDYFPLISSYIMKHV